jgi:hypothetical protein
VVFDVDSGLLLGVGAAFSSSEISEDSESRAGPVGIIVCSGLVVVGRCCSLAVETEREE